MRKAPFRRSSARCVRPHSAGVAWRMSLVKQKYTFFAVWAKNSVGLVCNEIALLLS
jgi:hypothetical protein